MQLLTHRSSALNRPDLTRYFPVLAHRAEQLQAVRSEAISYHIPESSLHLPHDETLLAHVQAALARLDVAAVRQIFLVGIGGSNLGTLAVAEALRGRISIPDEIELINLDTVSARDILALQARYPDGLSAESYVIFVVSKSGTTTETIANIDLLLACGITTPEAALQRTVCITDGQSPLAQLAEAHHVATLPIPTSVGGRYSVFSPVGLAPLQVLGIDTDELLRGAREIQPYCLHQDIPHNPAALSAVHQFVQFQQGLTVHDLFCFAPELESLGKWYRQLLGESIGKRENIYGEVVQVGLVPTVSIGSTDLHSMGQMYLGGNPVVLTTFLSVATAPAEFTVPTAGYFTSAVPMVADRTTSEIMTAIKEGTIAAYQELDRPFMEMELEALSAYELGAWMQCKMMEMMYLGALFAVSPFDQPAVENYKAHTRDYLAAGNDG